MTAKNKKHILIIEDSKDLQDLLRNLFETEGYILSQAFNGREALDLLNSMRQLPSLILLDIMMPVMDGIEFRREQKKDVRLAAIPVIVMTADFDAQSKAAQMDIGYVFEKSLNDIDKFIELVEKLSV